MRFSKYLTLTLNKIPQVYYGRLNENSQVAIAIVVVESWLRPAHLRYVEYLGISLGFNLTVGMCQARCSTYWLDEISRNGLLKSILIMENMLSNINKVENILFGEDNGRRSLEEIVEFYTGSKNDYYLTMLQASINEIESRKSGMKFFK